MAMGPKPVPLAQRFWAKVDVRGPDECWPWLGGTSGGGHGQIMTGSVTDGTRRIRSAHVVAWELHHGMPMPDGMFGCHDCDNPPCCNPRHVYAGTSLDNMRDKSARGRHHNQLKTHCPRGHEYTDENIYRIASRPNARYCRQCRGFKPADGAA